MPRISGTSDDFTEMLEDDIATMITAREDLQYLHVLLHEFRKRNYLEPDAYHEYLKILDRIGTALQVAKRHTAARRNGRVQ